MVRLSLEYEPEGLLEHIGDKLKSVERQVEENLQRFKAYIEGRASASRKASVSAKAAAASAAAAAGTAALGAKTARAVHESEAETDWLGA